MIYVLLAIMPFIFLAGCYVGYWICMRRMFEIVENRHES